MYKYRCLSDAIWGLRELLETHPGLMETSLTSIIQACARVAADEVLLEASLLSCALTMIQDAEVRKALLAFTTWFLRQVSIVGITEAN
jgi:pre-rRNA-processing protein IPI1